MDHCSRVANGNLKISGLANWFKRLHKVLKIYWSCKLLSWSQNHRSLFDESLKVSFFRVICKIVYRILKQGYWHLSKVRILPFIALIYNFLFQPAKGEGLRISRGSPRCCFLHSESWQILNFTDEFKGGPWLYKRAYKMISPFHRRILTVILTDYRGTLLLWSLTHMCVKTKQGILFTHFVVG